MDVCVQLLNMKTEFNVPGLCVMVKGYRAAFLRQIKIRVLTLQIAKEYEKVKIYRIPDIEGAQITG